mmetsp:Transcript_10214/g.26532  ORF Transcript_10214/g.26532 Transcript_10214/m.26532 type:complete len:231 (-) Transcript_10214:25-717(-)
MAAQPRGNNFANALMGACLLGMAYYGLYMDQADGKGATRGLTSTDPATGIKLPNEIKISGKSLELLGIGVRTKAGVVNVYSAGLYLTADVRKTLKPFAGKTSAQLARDPGFFTTVTAHSGPKAVILAFARDVAVAKVADALSAVPGARQSVKEELGKCITKNGDLRKGDQLMFNWAKKDTVLVKSKYETFCTIRDAPLASGLLGMYLGPQAVSPKLKASIAERAQELLSE